MRKIESTTLTFNAELGRYECTSGSHPNIVQTNDPTTHTRDGGEQRTLTFQVQGRCTAQGAEHDALVFLPQYLSPADDYAAEAANSGCYAWDPKIPARCLPTLWRAPLTVTEVPSKNSDLWDVEAVYTSGRNPGSETIQINTIGSYINLKTPIEVLEQSRCIDCEELEYYAKQKRDRGNDSAESENIPQPGGINVTHDGEVRGVQTYSPRGRFTLEKSFAPGALGFYFDDEFSQWLCPALDLLMKADGAVNSTDFDCYCERELQMQGFDILTSGVDRDCPFNACVCEQLGLPVRYQASGEDVLTCNFEYRPSGWIACGTTLQAFTADPKSGGIREFTPAYVPGTFPKEICTVSNPPGPDQVIYVREIFKAGFDVADIRYRQTEELLESGETRISQSPEFVYMQRVDHQVDFEALFEGIDIASVLPCGATAG